MADTTPETAPMTFGAAITTVFRKYADFTGTASRAEFWWFALFSTLVGMTLRGVQPRDP